MFATIPSFGVDYKGLGKLLTPSHCRLQLRRVAILPLEETNTPCKLSKFIHNTKAGFKI